MPFLSMLLLRSNPLNCRRDDMGPLPAALELRHDIMSEEQMRSVLLARRLVSGRLLACIGLPEGFRPETKTLTACFLCRNATSQMSYVYYNRLGGLVVGRTLSCLPA